MKALFDAAVRWCGFSLEQRLVALLPLEANAAALLAHANASSFSLARHAFICSGSRRRIQRPYAMSPRQGSLHGGFGIVSKARESVSLFMTSS